MSEENVRSVRESYTTPGALFATWAGRMAPEHFFDVDEDHVLVFVRVNATGKGSGVPVALRNAHEFTIRDGMLVRFKV